MPVPIERALEILERLGRGESVETLMARLVPRSPDDEPLPPHVPHTREWTEEARQERLEFLRERGLELPNLARPVPDFDPAELQGNIESFLGFTQIPTGLLGPLRINGLFAHGDFYVPMATSEGSLVASYDRGSRLISASGGASVLLSTEQVQRAPGFAFASVREAAAFAAWAAHSFERFQEVAHERTRHGRLLDMLTHVEANHVYLVFEYHTADASGQNMVTLCTDAVCQEILATTPVQPRHWFLEANLSGDKKATSMSFLHTRGRKVSAEVVLPAKLVRRGLGTTAERMCQYWAMSFVGGVQSGSIGVSGHIANGLAAMFLACGQDVACVSEASIGITRMELTDEGDLYTSVTLPNLIVGTVGGGTRLPTARECLRILDCEGAGKAAKFAEICAAVALAGEISIIGALCAGAFADAHTRLGRPR